MHRGPHNKEFGGGDATVTRTIRQLEGIDAVEKGVQREILVVNMKLLHGSRLNLSKKTIVMSKLGYMGGLGRLALVRLAGWFAF